MSKKIADILSAVLEEARKLCTRETASVDELERGVASIPDVIMAAQRECEALRARHREMQISGSDSDLEKLENEMRAADRVLDRLRVMAEELDARLARAREKANAEALARRCAEVVAVRDAAVNELGVVYPKCCTALVEMIEKLARAEIMVGDLNKILPADKQIQGVESLARSRIMAPHQEISRSTVDLWCREGEVKPLPVEHQESVKDNGDGRGFIPLRPNTSGRSFACVRRRFKRVEFRAPANDPFIDPLAQSLNLPRLVAGDPDFWHSAPNWTRPAEWLAAVEKLRAAPPASVESRPVQIEYRLVDDDKPIEPAAAE
jgi:hypothetical protein